MSIAATLQELARQVRGDTIQILEAAQPEWLDYAPPGTSNHILWHAGHALWAQDVLCVRLLSGCEELPAGWEKTFGMDCEPVNQTEDWPSRDGLRDLLKSQLSRVLYLLAITPDSRLAETADPVRGPAAVSDRIIHGLHDEAKHSGEMYLILKLCRGNV